MILFRKDCVKRDCDWLYKGDLITDEDLIVDFPLFVDGWVQADRGIKAGGGIQAGRWIKAGEWIEAGGGGIQAGEWIQAGGWVQAGEWVEAGEWIKAGGWVKAGAWVQAGEWIKAGGGIQAGGGIEAGRGIKAANQNYFAEAYLGIAFKVVADNYLSPTYPKNLDYSQFMGKELIADDFNPDINKSCGGGISLCTMKWAMRFYESNKAMRVLIVSYNTSPDNLCIPKDSDGKFRVRTCTVLRELPLEQHIWGQKHLRSK